MPPAGRKTEVTGPLLNAMAALSGAGMIDDFRLRGSRICRQMGVPFQTGGVDI